MRKLGILFIAGFFTMATVTCGQQRLSFEFGLRAGVPTQTILESDFIGIPGAFTVQQVFKKPSFTLGPTFAAVLYDRIVVQLDALYKPVRFSTNETTPVASIRRISQGGSWEFPLLFDYRFLRGPVRPYAGGGSIVGQTLSATMESRATFSNIARVDRTYSQFQIFDNQFPAYITNAGLEWNRSRIVIRPELRYTRWDDSKQNPKRRRDQVEFLIGFSVR